MTARQTPPSAMVEKVALVLEESPVPSSDDEQRALAMKCIAAMFDNLPREAMREAVNEIYLLDDEWPQIDHDRWQSEAVDAAISAARAEVLGSAKGDASEPRIEAAAGSAPGEGGE